MSRTASTAFIALALSLAAPAAAGAAPGIGYGVAAGGIRTVRTDGSGDRRIVDRTYARDPDFSPNGRRLLFDDPVKGVFAARGDGSHARRILDDTAFGARWSPDGRRVAYQVDRVTQHGEREIDHNSVWIADAGGRHRHRVHSGRHPEWAADGRHLIYTTGRGLVISDLHGRHHRMLSRSTTIHGAEVSPDGRTVAYARAGALHLIDVRTGRGRAIGSRRVGTGPLIDVAWTPDGRRLAYVRYPRHRRFELEEIRTSGHDRRRLFRFPAGVAILSITFTAG